MLDLTLYAADCVLGSWWNRRMLNQAVAVEDSRV